MTNRRRLVGPGVVLAVIAAYVGWREAPGRSAASRPALPPPGQASLPERPTRPAPEPGFVLEQREALRLNPRQVRGLTAVRDRYERETVALREALEWSAGSFKTGMQERAERGETLQGLQERGAAVSTLSRQLAAARRGAWEEAGGHLTAGQREQAEALWHARMTGRRP